MSHTTDAARLAAAEAYALREPQDPPEPEQRPRILVACEFSGIVRDSFTDMGWDAWSCDLLPTEAPGQHIQGDVREALKQRWDMVIAHPPCTYLASMSIWWNAKRPERWPLTHAALEFVKELWVCDCPCMAIENPIGYLSNHWMKPTQVIHPWQHGQEFSKPTCLWLRGLPRLHATKIVGKGEFYVKANGSRAAKWSHKTSGTDKEKRARIASRTFPGIAAAMAQQWGQITTAPEPDALEAQLDRAEDRRRGLEELEEFWKPIERR